MNNYTKLDAISPETIFINILLFYDAQHNIMH